MLARARASGCSFACQGLHGSHAVVESRGLPISIEEDMQTT